MAAAIVPIASALIPAAVPLVVRLVERLLGAGTGPAKLDAATEIVAAIQAGLQNTKSMAGQPLTGPQMQTLIEAAVQELNAKGVLKGSATAIDAEAVKAARIAGILEGLAELLRA